MKTLLLFAVMLMGLILACTSKPAERQTISWTCGEGALTVTKTFKTTNATNLKISLANASLCGSSGIKVVVTAGGNPMSEETFATFPAERTWPLPAKTDISITTEVVDVNTNIQCVRLGEVNCKAEY